MTSLDTTASKHTGRIGVLEATTMILADREDTVFGRFKGAILMIPLAYPGPFYISPMENEDQD